MSSDRKGIPEAEDNTVAEDTIHNHERRLRALEGQADSGPVYPNDDGPAAEGERARAFQARMQALPCAVALLSTPVIDGGPCSRPSEAELARTCDWMVNWLLDHQGPGPAKRFESRLSNISDCAVDIMRVCRRSIDPDISPGCMSEVQALTDKIKSMATSVSDELSEQFAAWILDQQGPQLQAAQYDGLSVPLDNNAPLPEDRLYRFEMDGQGVVSVHEWVRGPEPELAPMERGVFEGFKITETTPIPPGRRDDPRITRLIELLSGEPPTAETEEKWRQQVKHLRRDLNSDLRELKRLRDVPLVVKPPPTAARATTFSDRFKFEMAAIVELARKIEDREIIGRNLCVRTARQIRELAEPLAKEVSVMTGPGATDPRERQREAMAEIPIGMVKDAKSVAASEALDRVAPMNVRVLGDDQEPGRDSAVAEIEGFANNLHSAVLDAHSLSDPEVREADEALSGILYNLGTMHALPTVPELKRHSAAHMADLRNRIDEVIGKSSPLPNLGVAVENMVMLAGMYGWPKVVALLADDHGNDQVLVLRAAVNMLFPPTEMREDRKPLNARVDVDGAGPPTPRPATVARDDAADVISFIQLIDRKGAQETMGLITQMYGIERLEQIVDAVQLPKVQGLPEKSPEITIDNFIDVVSVDGWDSALRLIRARYGTDRVKEMQTALGVLLGPVMGVQVDPLQSPGLDIDRFVKLGKELGWRGVLSMMTRRTGSGIVTELGKEISHYLTH